MLQAYFNRAWMFFKSSFLLVFAVMLLACSGQTKIESDLGIKGAPDWVNEGTQAVNNKKGRLIQGVGSAQPFGDEALQRSTADQRARAEIAKVLSNYMNVVMQDYTSANNINPDGEVNSSIQQEINSVSKVVLSGSKIIGRWKDKRTSHIYSFAELDMKKFDKTLKATEKLNKNLKEYIIDHGSQAFDAFIQEIKQ